MDPIGVFEVASAGDDAGRLARNVEADKLAAAIYDVRAKHGAWLFGAADLDGFNDRAKLAYVDICRTIEPHLHARKGVHRRVLKAMEQEWREARRREAIHHGPTSVDCPECGERLSTSEARLNHSHEGGDTYHFNIPQPAGMSREEWRRKMEDGRGTKKASRRVAVQVGDRVELHPATDAWMSGDRYGDVVKVTPSHAHVQMDRSGKTRRVPHDLYQVHDPDRYSSRLAKGFDTDSPHTHPEMHNHTTYRPSDKKLIPAGDFDAYKDSVDQGAESKIDHDFVHGGGEVTRHDEDGAHNFVPTNTSHTSFLHRNADGRHQLRQYENDPGFHDRPVKEPPGLSRITPAHDPDDFTVYLTRTRGDNHQEPSQHRHQASLYPEYERIARLIEATGDPTSSPAGAPPPSGSGQGNSIPTQVTQDSTSSAAGSGTPVQPPTGAITGSREYQAIAALIREAAPPVGGLPEDGGNSVADVPISSVGPEISLPNGNVIPGVQKATQAVPKIPGRAGSRRHTADRNYLQQADEAITKVLNEKAEEFQKTIAPLQQALVTIQQAEQMQNPLNVSPPAGTVNVLPQQAQPAQTQGGQPDPGAGLPGEAASSVGGAGASADPLAGQQTTARRRSPKKAAGGASPRRHGADAEKGHAKPYGDTNYADPGYRGKARYPIGDKEHADAAKSYFDQSKNRDKYTPGERKTIQHRIDDAVSKFDKSSRHRHSDVHRDWADWVRKLPGARRGGDSDYEQFGRERGYGRRAIETLKRQHGVYSNGVGPAGKTSGVNGDHVWSTSPTMVRNEFADRLAAGVRPDDVFRELVDEIADHHRRGMIDNRSAHRAANEAFGRLLFSRRPSRKQAWMGWGPDQKETRHKVAGWDWDEHLNGYITTAHRRFECSCGQPVKVPDYHMCKCGKIWNTYVIGAGGDRHEAAAEKFIAREIPVRDDVIVASRRSGIELKFPADNTPDLADEVEDRTPFPSDHHPEHGKKMKSMPADWHNRDQNQRWVS